MPVCVHAGVNVQGAASKSGSNDISGHVSLMIRTRRGGEALAYEILQSRLAIQVWHHTLIDRDIQHHCFLLAQQYMLRTQKLVLLLLKPILTYALDD
jgi:hypothetical protein